MDFYVLFLIIIKCIFAAAALGHLVLAHTDSYFDKYDTSSDSRNMTRELRSSVYEDKNTGYTKESNKLLERNFDSRWLDTTVMKQQAQSAATRAATE